MDADQPRIDEGGLLRGRERALPQHLAALAGAHNNLEPAVPCGPDRPLQHRIRDTELALGDAAATGRVWIENRRRARTRGEELRGPADEAARIDLDAALVDHALNLRQRSRDRALDDRGALGVGMSAVDRHRSGEGGDVGGRSLRFAREEARGPSIDVSGRGCKGGRVDAGYRIRQDRHPHKRPADPVEYLREVRLDPDLEVERVGRLLLAVSDIALADVDN